jgi:cobalt-zinc-cadmium efflux system membrane fusion protein
MHRDRRIVALLLLLGSTGGARAHVGHAALSVRGITVSTGALTLTTEAAANLGVETAIVKEQPLEEVLVVPGQASVPPEKRVMLTSRVQGKVRHLHVRLGDAVSPGQELVELESLGIQAASLELAKAAADLALAGKNLERLTALSVPGIAPQRERLEAEAAVYRTRLTVEGLEAKLLALGVRSDDVARARRGEPIAVAVLRSPAAGVVTEFPASRGKVVSPGAVLVEIADTSRILVEGSLSAGTLARVQAGQPVRVAFPSLPGRVYAGTVDLVGSFLDETSRSLTVYVEIGNERREVRPEMFGELSIVVSSTSRALVCPAAALIHTGPEVLVLCAEEGRLVARPIVAGRHQGQVVEVLGGLFPGDRVVTKGSHELGTFFLPDELAVSPRGRRNMQLAWEPVDLAPLEEILTAPATVEIPPALRSFASSRVTGRVERVIARPGMRVLRDQPLAWVRSIEAGELVVSHRKAIASVKYLEGVLSRTRALVGAKVEAGKELVSAESELGVARGETENLRRRLASVGVDPDRVGDDLPLVPITAPASGVIFHSEVELGGFVEPDRHLLEIVETHRVWVEADVAEAQAHRVREGQAVRIGLIAYPDRVFEGRVAFLEPTVDKGHRAVHVVVELASEVSQGRLKPGMLGRMTIVLGKTAEVIRAPLAAVLSEAGEHSVMIHEGGKFFRQRVVVGRADDRFVEVRSGVYPGEDVVTRGVEDLRTAAMAVR